AGQEIENRGPRKLGRAPKAPFLGVVILGKLLVGGFQGREFNLVRAGGGSGLALPQGGDDFLALLGDCFVFLFPGLRNSSEDFFKSGLTVAILRREISPAHKWLQLRGQPDAHRPPAPSRG